MKKRKRGLAYGRVCPTPDVLHQYLDTRAKCGTASKKELGRLAGLKKLIEIKNRVNSGTVGT